MRLLLFDIDGTLLRSGGAGRAAMNAAFADEFGIDAFDDVQVDGRTDAGLFAEALDRVGVEPAPAAIARMIDAYIERFPASLAAHEGRVLGGVTELLDALALAADRAALGLATGNVARGAELKLRHYGLWDRFAAGGYGDFSADRTEIVTAAIANLARAADVEPASATSLVIGDTPRDVSAGHAAGARVLAVATGNYDEAILRESGADFVLPDLRDTEAALAILLG